MYGCGAKRYTARHKQLSVSSNGAYCLEPKYNGEIILCRRLILFCFVFFHPLCLLLCSVFSCFLHSLLLLHTVGFFLLYIDPSHQVSVFRRDRVSVCCRDGNETDLIKGERKAVLIFALHPPYSAEKLHLAHAKMHNSYPSTHTPSASQLQRSAPLLSTVTALSFNLYMSRPFSLLLSNVGPTGW